jgi:hypothetical protein
MDYNDQRARQPPALSATKGLSLSQHTHQIATS